MQPPPKRARQVEEMALLNTALLRWDGVRVYVPNALLLAEPLANVTRSRARWEGFKARARALRRRRRLAGREMPCACCDRSRRRLSRRAARTHTTLRPHHTQHTAHAPRTHNTQHTLYAPHTTHTRQVLVDIRTPPETFSAVDAAVAAHFAAQRHEFTGQHLVASLC